MRINRVLLFLFILVQGLRAYADWIPVDVTVDSVVVGQVTANWQADTETVSELNRSEILEILKGYLDPAKIRSGLPATATEDESLSLTELQRLGVQASFDEKEFRLNLQIPLDQRMVKQFPLNGERERPGLRLQTRPFSGYLNYSVFSSYTQQTVAGANREQYGPIQGQLELVQNLKYLTLENRAVYNEHERNAFQRQFTSLVHDNEQRQIRFRGGDFDTGVLGFQSALPALGVQMQKQFTIRPDLGSLAKRSALIQVKQNSIMEVYVNGSLISRIRVGPGPYNLRELPMLYGRNTVEVVLLDDFGGREEFTVDLMFDDQILTEGIHDFSYQVGVPSYYVGTEKNYADTAIASFYHRYGFTNAITFLTGMQTYRESQQFQFGVGLITSYGTHFLDSGYYRDDEPDAGSAWRWRYSSPQVNNRFFNNLRVFGGIESRSAHFKTIQYPQAVLPVFSEKYDLVLQQRLDSFGSISLAMTELKGQNTGTDESTRRVGWQTYFSREWMGDVSYEWSNQRSDQVLLTLTWNEAEGYSSVAAAYDSAYRESSLRYNRNNARNYEDFRLSALALHQNPEGQNSTESLDAQAEYFGRYVEPYLRVNGRRFGADESFGTQLGVRSAVAWTSEGWGLSRPISDSFALLQGRGLGPHAVILPDGSNEGLSLKDRQKIIYNNLTSYVESQIQVDSTELPTGYYLEREAYVIQPKYRTGHWVPIQVHQSVVVTGQLSAENPSLVNYAYGKIWTADGRLFSDSFFTDETGHFILDGLIYGDYEIELSDPRLQRIPLRIQESADTQTTNELDLGEIRVQQKAGT